MEELVHGVPIGQAALGFPAAAARDFRAMVAGMTGLIVGFLVGRQPARHE